MGVSMQTLNIKEARANLSRLVDMAESGETVVITRNGTKAARLGPVPTSRNALPDLKSFRAAISRPKTSLSKTVIASRREDRF